MVDPSPSFRFLVWCVVGTTNTYPGTLTHTHTNTSRGTVTNCPTQKTIPSKISNSRNLANVSTTTRQTTTTTTTRRYTHPLAFDFFRFFPSLHTGSQFRNSLPRETDRQTESDRKREKESTIPATLANHSLTLATNTTANHHGFHSHDIHSRLEYRDEDDSSSSYPYYEWEFHHHGNSNSNDDDEHGR